MLQGRFTFQSFEVSKYCGERFYPFCYKVYIKMKLILSFLSVVLFSSISFSQENNVEGLTIEFIKVSEDYVYQSYGFSNMGSGIYAIDGMKFVKIKMRLKNEGSKNCIFNFDDVYVSTEQDSLYRFYKIFKNEDNSVIIKPQKAVTKFMLVEFPDERTPKELFIEDKRYKISVKK
jgi:hypothetical protein